MGRAPVDSKFCAVWYALFESLVPIGRGLAPVFRYLIRGRAAVTLGTAPLYKEDVSALGFETASPFVPLGVTSA